MEAMANSAGATISIHPPREGWDLDRIDRIIVEWNFNPPTP